MPREALTALAMAGAATWTIPSRAEPCRVESRGPVLPEWQRAVESLAGTGLTDEDCIRVQIEVSEHGARVTFTSAEGTQAVRELTEPDELGPTIDALRVKGPPDPSESAAKARTEPRPSSPASHESRAAVPSEKRKPEEPPERVRGFSPMFALQLGGRGMNGISSPVLAGTIALISSRWELGLSVASEPQFEPPAPPASNPGASTIVLGASAGRREPVGVFAFLAGARLSTARIFAEDIGPSPVPADTRSFESRAGAYVGFTVPRSTLFRFRAELGCDIVFLKPPPDISPATPAWALSALIGVEVGGS
jgi:hypothetical protein